MEEAGQISGELELITNVTAIWQPVWKMTDLWQIFNRVFLFDVEIDT